MNAFLDDVCLRPSCYACAFKTENRDYADITLADFWGFKNVCPEFDDKKGTSLVLVNTGKGREIWDAVKDGCDYFETDTEKATRGNPTLKASARKKRRRERFFSDYENEGYAYVEKKYMSAFKWGYIRPSA